MTRSVSRNRWSFSSIILFTCFSLILPNLLLSTEVWRKESFDDFRHRPYL